MEKIVRFSASLYSEAAIHAAAAAYGVAVSVKKEAGDFAVEIDLADDVVDHFANHVLHETIVSRHAG
jgi:hypothetical protein